MLSILVVVAMAADDPYAKPAYSARPAYSAKQEAYPAKQEAYPAKQEAYPAKQEAYPEVYVSTLINYCDSITKA